MLESHKIETNLGTFVLEINNTTHFLILESPVEMKSPRIADNKKLLIVKYLTELSKKES